MRTTPSVLSSLRLQQCLAAARAETEPVIVTDVFGHYSCIAIYTRNLATISQVQTNPPTKL